MKYASPSFPAVFVQEGGRQFDRDLVSVLDAHAANLKGILDRGVSVDDNMDMRRVAAAAPAVSDTEFAVAHGLGKVPVGYVVIGMDAPGILYDGGTAATKTALYLKSTAGSVNYRILVF